MVVNMFLRCRCLGGHSLTSLTIKADQNASWLQRDSLSRSANPGQISAETAAYGTDMLGRGDRFNLDKPCLVEYTRDNHGRCRAMVAEKVLPNLAVHEPILPIGEKRCYFD